MSQDVFTLKGKYELDASGAQTTLQKLGTETEKTEKKFQGFADRSTIALAGVGVALGAAAAQLLKVSKAGANLERLQVSTYVLGQNMGLTKKQIDAMIQSLENTNTFGTNAWSAINTLTKSGLMPMIAELERANNVTGEVEKGFDAFIYAIKDLGAAAGVSSSKAINLVTTSINRMSPALLESLNITTGLRTAFSRYAEQNNITSRQLTSTEKKQAMLNMIMAEAEKITGTYSATYETAGKNLLSIQSAMGSTSEIIGQALQPAFRSLTGATLTNIKAFRDWAKDNQRAVVGIVAFVSAAGTLVFTILTFKKALDIGRAGLAAFRAMSIKTQASLGALSLVILAVSALFAKRMMDTVKETNNTETSTDALREAMKNLGKTGGNAMDQIKEKAGEASNRLRDVQKQIRDENREFNKQLAQIVDRRRENLENNKRSLAAEEREFKRKQDEMSEAYEKRTEDIKRQNEARLKDIEESMAATLVVGSETYEQDVANYTKALEEESKAHQKRLDEAKKEYKEETEAAKKEYEDRSSALKKKIAEDEAFLKKHAEIIKTINRSILEDEIEQLQRNHKERLEKIQEQLRKERGSYQDHFDGVDNDFKNMIENMNSQELNWDEVFNLSDMGETFKEIGIDILSFFSKVGGYMFVAALELNYKIYEILESMIRKIPGIGEQLADRFANLPGNKNIRQKTTDLQNRTMANASAEIKFATGGYVTSPGVKIVGEQGIEAVELPVGSKVNNNASTNRMLNSPQNNEVKEIKIVNYNNFYYPEDQNVFNQKLALQLRKQS